MAEAAPVHDERVQEHAVGGSAIVVAVHRDECRRDSRLKIEVANSTVGVVDINVGRRCAS